MESLDVLFDVFSKERRRYALYALNEADGPVGLEALAEQVGEWETEGDDVPDERFDDVILALKHTHLPKAARAEHVEYDHENEEVKITGDTPEFRIVLSVSEALETTGAEDVFDVDSLSADQFLSKLTSD